MNVQGGQKVSCCTVIGLDISKARTIVLTVNILKSCERSRTRKLATLILFLWLNIHIRDFYKFCEASSCLPSSNFIDCFQSENI